jgi:aspartokinase-like uncharacterized kinase
MTAGVSAEGFALAGDVHVWRGDLDPDAYTCPTPDGRPATREYAGERLARVVCADREMLDDDAISTIADALAGAQIERVADAINRVRARHPSLRTAVVTGLGAFIGAAAARASRLDVVMLADSLGDDAARCAPAASVALLFEDEATRRAGASAPAIAAPRRRHPALYDNSGRAAASAAASQVTRGVDIVVKIGGGILANGPAFDAALAVVADVARDRPLLIVPGGGPFADAVREVDGRLGLSDDAAHWMAILAIDEYAHLIVSRLPAGVLVARADQIAAAIADGKIPVLAPYAWLREADPLPHSWDVTSDSIAAWIAGAVGARSVVLVKPPQAEGVLVDPYFERALPSGVVSTVVPADRLDAVFQNSQRGMRAL